MKDGKKTIIPNTHDWVVTHWIYALGKVNNNLFFKELAQSRRNTKERDAK